MPTFLRGRRFPSVIAALLSALVLVLPIVIPSLVWGHARNEAQSAPGRAEVLYVTSGLAWADVDPETTPNLACFANKSGVASLAITSESLLSTKRQGVASLETGARTPQLTRQANTGNLDAQPAQLPRSVGGRADITIIDLGDVNVTGSARAHHASLTALDAAFASHAGPCGKAHSGASGNRAALASVGQVNPSHAHTPAVEAERSYAALPTRLQMQVYVDSGWGPAMLTSPSTRQPGVVMNVDIAPTLAGKESVGIGRAIEGTPVPAASGHDTQAVELAKDIGASTRLTEDALGAIVTGLGAILGLAVLGASPLTTRFLHSRQHANASGSSWRERTRRVSHHALAVGVLAVPAALTSRVLPLDSIAHAGVPVSLALLVYIVALAGTAGALLVCAVQWARTVPSLMVPAAAGLMTVGLICLDSLLGSHAQLTSVFGNQPLYAGRFYGMANHLAGIMLASWILGIGALIHALPAFTRHPRAGLWRTILVAGTGLTTGVIAIAPGLGADAGSALIYLPATVLGCLLVSGLRVRVWHIATALLTGIAVFFGAGFLDYLRPAHSRTHLGTFIAQILGESGTGHTGSGMAGFISVFAGRTARMLEPLWVYPWFAIVPAVVVGVGVVCMALRPGSRFAHLFPYAWRLRAVGIGTAFIGAATNDTGLVLIAAALIVGAILSSACQFEDGAPAESPEPRSGVKSHDNTSG